MSAFGYFGSKLRIAAKMHDKLPPHSAWVELFCGSAAMTIAKRPAPIEVINDINEEIVNFYQQLRDHSAELLQKITFTPYARVELELARTPHGEISDVERARRFFVAAMMAVNGSFGAAKGGFSISNSYSRNGMEARVNRWHGMPDYLLTVIERLKKVRIEKKDAIVLFEEFSNRPGTLAYLDPPYLGDRVKGYDCDEGSLAFHGKLLAVAQAAKCMVFISGYDSDLYNDLLTTGAGWEKQTIRAVTKGNNGKSFHRTEVLWFNHIYSEARRIGELPLRLDEKEQKNRKVNPTR
jgi:DNA adenine methylase